MINLRILMYHRLMKKKNNLIYANFLVLRSESPSDNCAKLRTVEASNNRDHLTRSLLLIRATYVWVLFFAHIPFAVNRTFNATPTERLQH